MSGLKTVIVTDDNDDDRLFLAEALINADPELYIIETKSGQDLINILKNEVVADTPALIVLGMNMPNMNGIKTMWELKRMPGTEGSLL